MKKFIIVLILNIVLIGNHTEAQQKIVDKYSFFYAGYNEIMMVDSLPEGRGGQITFYKDNTTKIEILSNSFYEGWDFFEMAMNHEFCHRTLGIHSSEYRTSKCAQDVMDWVNQLK